MNYIEMLQNANEINAMEIALNNALGDYKSAYSIKETARILQQKVAEEEADKKQHEKTTAEYEDIFGSQVPTKEQEKRIEHSNRMVEINEAEEKAAAERKVAKETAAGRKAAIKSAETMKELNAVLHKYYNIPKKNVVNIYSEEYLTAIVNGIAIVSYHNNGIYIPNGITVARAIEIGTPAILAGFFMDNLMNEVGLGEINNFMKEVIRNDKAFFYENPNNRGVIYNSAIQDLLMTLRAEVLEKTTVNSKNEYEALNKRAMEAYPYGKKAWETRVELFTNSFTGKAAELAKETLRILVPVWVGNAIAKNKVRKDVDLAVSGRTRDVDHWLDEMDERRNSFADSDENKRLNSQKCGKEDDFTRYLSGVRGILSYNGICSNRADNGQDDLATITNFTVLGEYLVEIADGKLRKQLTKFHRKWVKENGPVAMETPQNLCGFTTSEEDVKELKQLLAIFQNEEDGIISSFKGRYNVFNPIETYNIVRFNGESVCGLKTVMAMLNIDADDNIASKKRMEKAIAYEAIAEEARAFKEGKSVEGTYTVYAPSYAVLKNERIARETAKKLAEAAFSSHRAKIVLATTNGEFRFYQKSSYDKGHAILNRKAFWEEYNFQLNSMKAKAKAALEAEERASRAEWESALAEDERYKAFKDDEAILKMALKKYNEIYEEVSLIVEENILIEETIAKLSLKKEGGNLVVEESLTEEDIADLNEFCDNIFG